MSAETCALYVKSSRKQVHEVSQINGAVIEQSQTMLSGAERSIREHNLHKNSD